MRTLGPFGAPQRPGRPFPPDSSTNLTDRATGILAPKRPSPVKPFPRPTADAKGPEMHPFRAFLFSLTCGLALLFSVRGLVYAMQPSPDQRVGSGPIAVPTA